MIASILPAIFPTVGKLVDPGFRSEIPNSVARRGFNFLTVTLDDLRSPQGRKAFFVIAEFVQQLASMLAKAGRRVCGRRLIAFNGCVDSPVGAVAFQFQRMQPVFVSHE